MKKVPKFLFLLFFLVLFGITGCSSFALPDEPSNTPNPTIAVPDYDEQQVLVLNDNIPNFTDEELSRTVFEHYSDLDELGRCGVAFAMIGPELMPTEERGSIASIKPSGWHTIKYDFIDGKYLYNRCHLIGYQLTGENANEKNLITCTRKMNVELMLPFENMVADYIKEIGNHVLYRVTPVYEGNNLVAKGVEMEAKSVEDNGESILFHVFVYNVQDGVKIDYATGASKAVLNQEKDSAKEETTTTEEVEIRGNASSKIYHCPNQADYDEMKDSPNLVIFHSEEEAQAAGYRKAKR